jgi:heat shock protein HtpX
MNLYDQQSANRRRTWLIVVAFIAFLFLLGAGFDAFYIGETGSYVPIGSIVALGVGSVSALTSYFVGDRAVLAAAGAVPVEQVETGASEGDLLKLRQLENVVDEMAIAAGLPRPRVYVVPDPDPNAFATGRSPEHASLAVTRGLLDMLNREELQGVVAHEMSHIRNLDVRVLTLVAALVGAVALLSDWARRGMMWGGGSRRRDDDRDRGGGFAGIILFVIWLIAIVLAPILAQALAMMVSRQREYLADASGAELTRNPLGLASALEKIEDAVEPTRAINHGSAHLCIADPLGRQTNVSEGVSGWFASHPPMAARIAALKAMAFQA